MRKWRRESGSVTVIMAAALVLVGSLLLMIGRLGGAATDRARARTAADAAALAGAAEGCAAAGELAAVDGGLLISCTEDGMDVQVSVALGSATATARARRDTDGGDPTPSPTVGEPPPWTTRPGGSPTTGDTS